MGTIQRKGYRFGVEWIALNDEPEDTDDDSVAEYISTGLLADLFNKDTAVVARDVVKYRIHAHVDAINEQRRESSQRIREGEVTL